MAYIFKQDVEEPLSYHPIMGSQYYNAEHGCLFVPHHLGLDFAFPECSEIDNDCMALEFANGDSKEKKVVAYKYHVGDRKGLMPERVIVNGKATIGFNECGEKFIVKCGECDNYDPVVGFLYIYFLMNSGMSKSQASKFFNEFERFSEKDKAVEKILNNKRLGLDDYEKEMRKVIDEYMS